MQASLPALLRSIAPVLRQQSAAPALSLASWYAWRQASSATGGADPFTEQMQHKTEQELLELVEKARGSQEQQQEEPQDGAAAEAQVGRASCWAG